VKGIWFLCMGKRKRKSGPFGGITNQGQQETRKKGGGVGSARRSHRKNSVWETGKKPGNDNRERDKGGSTYGKNQNQGGGQKRGRVQRKEVKHRAKQKWLVWGGGGGAKGGPAKKYPRPTHDGQKGGVGGKKRRDGRGFSSNEYAQEGRPGLWVFNKAETD